MSAVSLNTEHRKLKSGERVEYWYLRWYGPDGKRRAKCIGRTDEVSKTKARRIRLRKMADLEMHPGQAASPDGPGLGAYVKHFLETKAGELEASSITVYRYASAKAIGFFGASRRMARIVRTEAREFKAALAHQKLSRASVETYFKHITVIFNQAVKDELILGNPFSSLGKTLPADRDWHYVSKQEFRALLKAARDSWVSIVALCRLAGLRRTEALRLRPQDINWQKKTMRVIGHGPWDPKSRRSRVVPMCRELQKILKEAGAKSTKLANPCRDFKVLCRRAGVKAYSKPFHSLRKSCARDWAQRFPAHVVREWLGHSSLETTDRYYLQVPPSEYRRASRIDLFPKE